MNNAFAKTDGSAKSTATAISIAPIRLDTPWTLRMAYIQDMSGLCAISGCVRPPVL